MVRHIHFFGPFGSGKTTYAKLLSDFLDVPLHSEEANSPFLEDMFLRNKHALLNQLYFLYSDKNQIVKTLKSTNCNYFIFDYHIAQVDLMSRIFLKKYDYAEFKTHYSKVAKKLPVPDLIFYIDTDEDVIVDRIAMRGRSYEQEMLKIVPRIKETIQYYIDLLNEQTKLYRINSNRDVSRSILTKQEVLNEMVNILL